jgi:tRNA(Ile)-lysidine synthase
MALKSDFTERLLRLAGPRPRVVLAFSGGLDSTALGHALLKRRRRLGDLRFVHVDHGLQEASAAWSRHCHRMAQTWKVPLVVVRIQVELPPGASLEAAARDARYAALAGEMRQDELLVTAQHRDDQVETLLLQLLRGAGATGLAAMPALASFGAGRLARPLLDVSRAELEAYARAWKLTWVEDPSNARTQFGRNYLRHRVLPVIRERWPGMDATVARTARHMAEADALLGGLARSDLAAAADGAALRVSSLRALPQARRRNALRRFIADAGVDAPPTRQLDEIVGSMLLAREDAQPEVRWGGTLIRRRSGRLELKVMSEGAADSTRLSACKSWRWSEEREFPLNGREQLALVDDPQGPLDLDSLPEVLELRARGGGETLRPAPRARTQSLKKLMQAAKLTKEERASLPLLYAGEGPKGRLIAAGDRWLDASVQANVKSRRRARLVWTRE